MERAPSRPSGMSTVHLRAYLRSGVTLLATSALLVPAGAGAARATDTEQVTGQLLFALTESYAPGTVHDEAPGEIVAAIRTADQGLVEVDAADVSRVAAGSRVTASLTDVAGADPADVQAIQVVSPPTTVAQTTAPQQVWTAVVTPRGVTADPNLTSETIAALVGRSSVYWGAQSDDQQVTFAIAGAVAPYTSAFTCSDYWSMWNEAAGRATGFTGGANQHLVLLLPRAAYSTGGCSYGLGTVGSGVTSGGYLYVSDLSTSALSHELGHNMSLRHAASFSDAAGESATTDAKIAYGNQYDVMGYSFGDSGTTTAGNVSAVQQARLGLLPAAQQVTKTASGTSRITLTALDRSAGTAPANPRLLTVTDPRSGFRYYVEYRARLGNDINAPWALTPGVLIERDSTNAAYETTAVDTTKASGRTTDQALTAGRTWTSVGGGVSMSIVATTSTTVTLDVGVSTSGTPLVVTPTLQVTSAQRTYWAAGQVVATLSPSTTTGTVSFSARTADGASLALGSATVAAGVASLPWTPVPVAGRVPTTIVASFTPSTTAFAPVSASTAIAVAARQTTTSATQSGNTVAVQVSASGAVPVGTVTVTATDQSSGRVVTRTGSLGSGRAVVDLVGAGDGAYTVVAHYDGDAAVYGFAASSPSEVTLSRMVVADPRPVPVVSVTPTPATVPLGASSNVVVQVTAPGGVIPTGKVTLTNGTTTLAPVSLSSGRATIKVTPAALGSVTWTASYTGSAAVRPASGSATVTTVAQTTRLTATGPAKVAAGAPITLRVVSATSNGTVRAVPGTVTITPDVGPAVQAATTGSVSVTLPGQTTSGPHTFTVSIPATATTLAATTTVVVTVTALTSRTTVTAPTRATVGMPIDVAVRVTSGTRVPEGEVSVLSGTTVLATASLVAGAATVPLTFSAAGSQRLTIVYSGKDPVLTSSVSRSLTVVVAPSTVTFEAPAQVVASSTVPVAVRVTAANGVPTGTVQVRAGTAVLSSAQLVDGAATLTVPLGAPGLKRWKVVYLGSTAARTSSVPLSLTSVA